MLAPNAIRKLVSDYKWPIAVGGGLMAATGVTGFLREKKRRAQQEALIANMINQKLEANPVYGLQKEAFLGGVARAVKGVVSNPSVRNVASRGAYMLGSGLRRAGLSAARGMNALGKRLQGWGSKMGYPHYRNNVHPGLVTGRVLPSARASLPAPGRAPMAIDTTARYA